MVGDESHIAPLERTLAVLGRMNGDISSIKGTVEHIDQKVTRIESATNENTGRIVGLEEREKARTKKVVTMGAGSGFGAGGLLWLINNIDRVAELLFRGVTK